MAPPAEDSLRLRKCGLAEAAGDEGPAEDEEEEPLPPANALALAAAEEGTDGEEVAPLPGFVDSLLEESPAPPIPGCLIFILSDAEAPPRPEEEPVEEVEEAGDAGRDSDSEVGAARGACLACCGRGFSAVTEEEEEDCVPAPAAVAVAVFWPSPTPTIEA